MRGDEVIEVSKDGQRLEEIFGKAITLTGEERDAYLHQACSGAKMRREIETLIRADEAAGDFLLDSAPLPSEGHQPAPVTAGERLGSYRILKQIGEGGMGTVFLAERDDGLFQHQVAIKILRWGTESARAIERFHQERRILAGMDHPGIARLLDGGTTATGLPFVVMEYFAGQPIDRVCDSLDLSAKSRVERMIDVCAAVSAAHRNLIVHRDLKPSNILLNEAQDIKLLDFGIAKWLDLENTEPTVSWDQRLTPSYASPEQLRGDPVTVATDVYLLGLVLYKLLAGCLPFDFHNRSLLEVERRITTETPRRPSDLMPGLDGDQDAIVLKALRPDPQDRYRTVDELAADLERYVEGLPVEARRGNARYRVGKFVRRHWMRLSAVLLFLGLVAAFAVSSWIQAKRVERTLERLVTVEDFVGSLFEGVSPAMAKGREVSILEVLERGEKRLDEAPLQGEPGSRGLLHSLFGRMALHLGRLEQGSQHFERALATFDEVATDPYFAAAQVRTRSQLARALLYSEEEFERAERIGLEALEQGRRLSDLPSEQLLELLDTVSHIYCWKGDWKSARPFVNEAVQLLEAPAAIPAAISTASMTAASVRSRQALLLKNLDRNLEASAEAYGEALKILLQVEGTIHPEVAVIQHQLGLLASRQGNLADSVHWNRESLATRRQLYPEGHWEIAQSLFQLAMSHWRAESLEDAESAMAEAWRLLAENPDRGPAHGRTIQMWIFLTEIRNDLGRTQEASRMLEELSPEWWQSRKPTSRLLPLARRALGCVLADQGEHKRASEVLHLSLDALRKQKGPDDWDTRRAADCLAELPENASAS